MDTAKRIEPDELKRLLDAGSVTVLDLRRDSWQRSDRKIPGAIRGDADRLDASLGALPTGRTVVTYCT